MNYQDWKDENYNELFSMWRESGTQKSFDNYCLELWEKREDDY